MMGLFKILLIYFIFYFLYNKQGIDHVAFKITMTTKESTRLMITKEFHLSFYKMNFISIYQVGDVVFHAFKTTVLYIEFSLFSDRLHEC